MNAFEIAQFAIFAGMDDEDVEILLDACQEFEQTFDGIPEKLDEFIENCDKTIEAFNA